MICPHCQQEHPDTLAYCPNTGKSIKEPQLICPNCGPEPESGALYCSRCGKALVQSPDQPDRKAPARRPLTWLLVGVSAMAVLIVSILVFINLNKDTTQPTREAATTQPGQSIPQSGVGSGIVTETATASVSPENTQTLSAGSNVETTTQVLLPGGDAHSIAYGPNDLLAVGGTTAIVIYKASTMERLHILPGRGDNLRWSPDGSQIASSSSGSSGSTIYDIQREAVLHTIHSDNTNGCRGNNRSDPSGSWSPDGSRFYWLVGEEAVEIWDAKTWELSSRTEIDPRGFVVYGDDGGLTCQYGLAWSQDGSRFAMYPSAYTDSDSFVRFYNPETARMTSEVRLKGDPRAAAFSPAGDLLAVAGSRIYLVQTDSGQIVRDFEGATDYISWSPDGSKLLLQSYYQQFWVLDASSGNTLFNNQLEELYKISFTPNPSQLAITRNGSFEIWTLDPWQKQIESLDFGGVFLIFGGHWSPDGDHLAVPLRNNAIRMYNLANGSIRTVQTDQISIIDLSWHPSGDSLLVLDANDTLVSWDLASDQAVWNINKQGWRIGSARYSPDGRWIAVTMPNGETPIAVLDANTRSFTGALELPTPFFPFGPLHWSHDSRYLSIINQADNARLLIWEVESGKLIGNQLSRSIFVNWSPVANHMAWIGENNRVEIFDVENSKIIAAFDIIDLKQADDAAIAIIPFSWSPDGKNLLVTGMEQSLILAASDGSMLGQIDNHREEFPINMSWSPNGNWIVLVGSQDRPGLQVYQYSP